MANSLVEELNPNKPFTQKPLKTELGELKQDLYNTYVKAQNLKAALKSQGFVEHKTALDDPNKAVEFDAKGNITWNVVSIEGLPPDDDDDDDIPF